MVDKLKVLFVVEGFTDIRLVTGLSEICELTMVTAGRQYRESGLKERVAQSGAKLAVDEIEGGRLIFQAASLAYIWKNVNRFDIVLAHEVLRGALSASVVGVLRGVPVATYMGISPLDYFLCRRARGQISAPASFAGASLIKFLLTVNGKLATTCLAGGPYLRGVASEYFQRTDAGLYYGVDTHFFHPANDEERAALRRKLNLPMNKFIVFLSSRISHEKDPETILRATALARSKGLDAVLLNLSGGYEDFIQLARNLDLPGVDEWVIARPAVHPMTEVADYFRAADVMALASLAEGLGMSPLEALACETPVVATEVGGLTQLRGYAQLTPRQDHHAMATALLWVAEHPEDARRQAQAGREFVLREWSREKAFTDLEAILRELAETSKGRRRGTVNAEVAPRH